MRRAEKQKSSNDLFAALSMLKYFHASKKRKEVYVRCILKSHDKKKTDYNTLSE